MAESYSYTRLTIVELSKEIKDGNIKPTQLVEYSLKAIKKLNPKLNSFITVLNEHSIQEAERLENELTRGIYRGTLHGIPFSVKDIISVSNVTINCGIKIIFRS